MQRRTTKMIIHSKLNDSYLDFPFIIMENIKRSWNILMDINFKILHSKIFKNLLWNILLWIILKLISTSVHNFVPGRSWQQVCRRFHACQGWRSGAGWWWECRGGSRTPPRCWWWRCPHPCPQLRWHCASPSPRGQRSRAPHPRNPWLRHCESREQRDPGERNRKNK